ncbi:DNA-binding protein [Haloarcula sp. Atlit-47R]|uniref:helix-turn-helix transcriptional regulator n=1 Tax=Haloarcula sp. Atlit-47R TaxID=2282132 RepID=UPI000EF2696C|nr:helix-turn-helix transcriptional regulator [Haloarcula sp. Atlit-47R]RLM41297.1 DNA-binding protein [Haloarcula sp. Atlit-47R]
MTIYHELTGFQRDLLEAIAAVDDDPYGLALKDYLDERYAEPINHSRLYQNLDQLVDQNLINRDELDARTNVYTLTDAGGQELQHQAETLAGLCKLSRPVADGGTQ